MFKVIIPALLIFGASACTSSQTQTELNKRALLEQQLQAALLAEDLGIVCDDVQPVGSRIERRVCTTAEQRELDHVRGKRFVERIQTNSLIGNIQ